MKTFDAIGLANTWGKSHRLILLAFGLIAIVSLVTGWYYVMAARQVSRTVTEPVNQTQPTVAKPLPDSPPADVTTIQSVTTSGNKTQASTNVEVNGQQIKSPSNGSVHRVIQNPNGITTVDISADNNSSGSGSSSSSTHVNLKSSSSNEINDSRSQSIQSVP